MKQFVFQLGLFISMLLTSASLAYTRNADLRSQLKSEPYRVLPSSKLFAAAINGHLFYRLADPFPGYYHGGYWIDNFAEVNPWEKLAVNGKFVLYNPAASYGVAATSYIHPFVTVSWNDDLGRFLPFDLQMKSNFFYLDRQTLGAGLTLEDKEMSGILLELVHGKLRLKFIQDGTGGYNINGDVHYLGLDFMENLLGVAIFDYEVNSPAFVTIFSSHPLIGDFSYFAELGRRRERYAGLLGVKHQAEWTGYFSTRLKTQIRRYESGFADRIAGRIEHDYLSIEQEDKSFTNSENIFVWGDNVDVGSIELGFTLKPAPWLRLDTDNEFYVFDFKDQPRESGYFYRHSIGVCPRSIASECGYIVASNKITSAMNPISYNDNRNVPFFSKRTYLGIEARLAF